MSTRFFRLYLKLLRGVAVSFIFSLALVSAAEAEVCFLPTVGAGGSCSGSSGNPNPNLEKCPTGYAAYASKPNCGSGKNAEQNGTVNGKGCYKCVDEKSSDCDRGKLEKDLGTCVDGKAKKDVGSTNSGLTCYECVDDVCPTGYTSDSESCKNSQNTGYAVLKEGVKTPSGGRCYTCGSCKTGYQYQNSTPDDTECTHWTQETGTSCYKPSDTEKVSACPKGGTQTQCGAGQTVTESYENSCGKMCYKCEADSGESNDPSANKCICPVNQSWDEKSDKCVDKEVKEITIEPEFVVDTWNNIQCNRTEDTNNLLAEITYTFTVKEINFEAWLKEEDKVGKNVTVYMWIIDASYVLSAKGGVRPRNQEGPTLQGGKSFVPWNFDKDPSYTLVSCTIPAGQNHCEWSSKWGNKTFTVKTTAVIGVNDNIRCPNDLNEEDDFSPMLIPYRYIGVSSSADDDYQYTAKMKTKYPIVVEKWSRLDAAVWFGKKFADDMKGRCEGICPKDAEGNYDPKDPNLPACSPFGHQGDFEEESLRGSDVMSRLTSNTCTYEHNYDTWPIEALNGMDMEGENRKTNKD